MRHYHASRHVLRGVYGSGQLGPVDADWRGSVEQPTDATAPEPTPYCYHTGQDYWPRPCDSCLARSEAESRKVAR